MAAEQSYVGLTDHEISQTWRQRFLGDYSQADLDRIDRKWRRLGKLIAKGRRTESRKHR